MGIPLYQVDAFAEEAFTGNPAAVCIVEEAFSNSTWCQSVAIEMNLSETAFVRRIEEGKFDLRWFTPGAEVDLCGHATLAAAFVLWETERQAKDKMIRFQTRSGELQVTKEGDQLCLNFPSQHSQPTMVPHAILESLGCEALHVERNKDDYLVEVADAKTLNELQPDLRQLATLEARGVIVTAKGEGTEYDFVSRFFGPAVGVDEDPVTGSAHCCLGPYWEKKLGRSELVGYQASKRGGVVRVRCLGERVELRGQAVMVFAGELLATP